MSLTTNSLYAPFLLGNFDGFAGNGNQQEPPFSLVAAVGPVSNNLKRVSSWQPMSTHSSVDRSTTRLEFTYSLVVIESSVCPGIFGRKVTESHHSWGYPIL